MQSTLQSRHTSFKVPLASEATPSVAAMPAAAIPVEPANGEIISLSAAQGEPSPAVVSPVAVATETASTIPPVAAATPVTPVAAVPYLTLKIILSGQWLISAFDILNRRFTLGTAKQTRNRSVNY